MLQGYFVPRFEEVFKEALEEYQEINTENEAYPQKWLVKNKSKKKEVKND